MTRQILRQLYVRWLPLALGLTAAANLAVTPFVPGSAQPVRFHDESSLTHLAHTEQRTVDRRYGFYMKLGDVASGDILMIPRDSLLEVKSAKSLSRVVVTRTDYDPTTIKARADELGEPIGVVETDAGDLPYWIVPGQGDRWWVGVNDDGILVIEESELREPPR